MRKKMTIVWIKTALWMGDIDAIGVLPLDESEWRGCLGQLFFPDGGRRILLDLTLCFAQLGYFVSIQLD